jgi:hypothetical protein
MELLYFDIDHGVERLLFVRLNRQTLSVDFRLEKGPDPTHDEESAAVPTASMTASTRCPDLDQFFGFCRAFVAAMRETSFLLQDPGKRPFAPMPHDALALEDIGEGVAMQELACRIPVEIGAEIFGPDRIPERFKPLVATDA